MVICAIIVGTVQSLDACTICGCSASNQYLGILPQFSKQFVGLQYQFRSFQSEHLAHSENGKSKFSQEYYNTLQLWGRYNLSHRIQLFAFVPYVKNIKTEKADKMQIDGIGDISVLANYQLLTPNDSSTWKHSLQAGGGVKMPTGHFDKTTSLETEGLPNMQTGTNSLDYLMNVNYTLKRESIGLNLDASYTLTQPNDVGYKFGNRISAGLLAFYWFENPNFIVIPQLGVRYDHAEEDYENFEKGWFSDMNGGYQLYLSSGVQFYKGSVGVQLSAHLPIKQHYADGRVNTKFKGEAGVFLLF